MGDAVGERIGLAGTGACNDQQRTGRLSIRQTDTVASEIATAVSVHRSHRCCDD